jgi:hypothetical protein
MKYNWLYGVVIGISCNFMYSMHEQHEPVQTISVEHFQQLNSKVDQLYAQVNPSFIKSWLIWGGKWALIGGGVSIASYLTYRYVFDLASPQDLQRAVNRIRKDAKACNDEFVQHTQDKFAEIAPLIAGAIDHQQFQQADQLNQLDHILTDRFIKMKNGLCGVEQLVSSNPELVKLILNKYSDQEQAALEQSSQQLQLELNQMIEQADKVADEQKRLLGYVEEGFQNLNGQALVLYNRAQEKARQAGKDRDKIQRGFELMQDQQRRLKELERNNQRGSLLLKY